MSTGIISPIPVLPSTTASHTPYVRSDGRADTAFRPYFMRLGVNSQASGSAYMEMGNNKVLVSIYGPRENPKITGDMITNGSMDVLVQYAPFALRPRISSSTALLDQERTLARQIEAALVPCILLDRFPKSIIEIHVLIIESDGNSGNILCCGINSTSLALVNGGIDMVDIGIATQCIAIVPGTTKDNQSGTDTSSTVHQYLVDPTPEETTGTGTFPFSTVLALLPQSGLVTLTISQGESNPLNMIQSLKVCMDGCLEMYQQMRSILIEEGTKRAKKALANRKRI